MSPEKQNPALPLAGGNRAEAICNTDTPAIKQHQAKKQQTSLTIATIQKSHSSQLRISLACWRGSRTVELQECSATVPGMFWPTASKVVLDVEHLPELIAALKAAATELLR
jgi:hypothetical protein